MDSDDGAFEDVEISGEMIRLGQLLKYVNVAESGAHAAAIIGAGDVRIGGEVETRRGRQLFAGDLVEVSTPAGSLTFRVTSSPSR